MGSEMLKQLTRREVEQCGTTVNNDGKLGGVDCGIWE